MQASFLWLQKNCKSLGASWHYGETSSSVNEKKWFASYLSQEEPVCTLSNTLDVNFCIATFQEATDLYGLPAIFNSDQGSQFTSNEFISELQSHNIRINMDGKGRALDNIYVKRLWRSLK